MRCSSVICLSAFFAGMAFLVALVVVFLAATFFVVLVSDCVQ
jgi:hypothetical protein